MRRIQPFHSSLALRAIVTCIVMLSLSTTIIQGMRRTTMEDFFPEIFARANLSEVTWDHAVNSKKLLSEALADDKHMIEADVLLGRLINNPDALELTVIMGHPPMILSDLTLQEFLDEVLQHNTNVAAVASQASHQSQIHGKPKKGVKLDFKSSKAYERAMSPEILLTEDGKTVKEKYTKFPLWINGDIAKGPGQPWTSGVDLQLDRIEKMPEVMDAVTWSLGWTTGDYKEGDGEKYTTEQVDTMKQVIQGIGNVTFPVRAMYAAKSRPEMEELLKVGTLTIWSGKQDDEHVDVVSLTKLIKDYLGKIYVDVPDSLKDMINQHL